MKNITKKRNFHIVLTKKTSLYNLVINNSILIKISYIIYFSLSLFLFNKSIFRQQLNSISVRKKMSSAKTNTIPNELSEEQIKFWLSNTNLSREELIKWYASFKDFAAKNKNLNRENFFKFFEQLNHAKKDSETFYKLAFNGNLLS